MIRAGTSPMVRSLALALLLLGVLAARSYTDLDRVRHRLVTTPRPVTSGVVSVPLRDQGQLAGLPAAVIVKVQAGDTATDITIAVDGQRLASGHVDAGETTRIDTAIDRFAAEHRAITVAGTAAAWTLTYLEVATVHGYAGAPIPLVIVPRGRQAEPPLPPWLLLVLFPVLVWLRPRGGWPAGAWKYFYRPLALLFLVLLIASLASPWLTRYGILLAFPTVLLAALVLYAEPLSRVAMPLVRRAKLVIPEPPTSADLPGRREVLTASAGLLAVLLIVVHVQVRNLGSVPDLGDPLFSIWRMSWVQHQLVADPRRLFDANIFYPAKGTLAYSDSVILPALSAWPLAAIGLSRVLAYNLIFLSGFFLSGVATFILARSFGWGGGAAWISALVFMLYSFRFDHYSHLELQMTQWMPLAVLGVHRLMTHESWRAAALVAAALAAQWYSCMYYALFLSLYVMVFALVLAIVWKRRRAFAIVAGSTFVGGIIALPLAIAYTTVQSDRGTRPTAAIAQLSARPGDYLQPTARSALYAGLNPVPAHGERQLFPGIAPIVLAAAGGWPPLGPTRLAILASGAAAFDGSLGMNGLSYPWLYDLFFPFQSIRVPARFAMLVGLSLALLSGAAVERWRTRVTRRLSQTGLIAGATLFVVVDAWPRLELVPGWPTPPPLYASLGPASGAVLMEYPLNPHPESFPENIPYLYFSTWHHTPMVNGYSGFSSPGYPELARAMADFPRGTTLPYLSAKGVTHITVVCALDGVFASQGVPQGTPEKCTKTIEALDADPRVRAIVRSTWQGAPALLYEIQK